MSIESDLKRFNEIVKGKIKQNLKEYISKGEMQAQKGKHKISVPLDRIVLPKFVLDPNPQKNKQNNSSQSGQGKSQKSSGQNAKPSKGQQAGQGSSEHEIELDISIEELANMLAESLELPNIEQKTGQAKLEDLSPRYNNIHNIGPKGLMHFKRTYKQALKRSIASGQHTPGQAIVPIKSDFRYRAAKNSLKPIAQAVIFYLMDVSGSMGKEQKDIVRTESFWIDTWISSHYKNISKKYIIHDAKAKEVDEHTFYHTRESGGTIISSAYRLCEHLIDQGFSPLEWNIYVFHFSDGDNWSNEDTEKCLHQLQESLLKKVNLFCYGQVDSQYGTGQFIKDLHGLEGNDRFISSQIKSREDIVQSIQKFLGSGK